MPTITKTSSEKPGETTALGLLRYALEYFAAAHATDRAIGDDRGHEIHAPMVVNFLLGQAVELALKALLVSKGTSVQELKNNYRHDLLKLFDAARKLGFGTEKLETSERPMIWLLNPHYRARELQYFRSGTKDAFPVAAPLKVAVARIVRAALSDVPHGELLLPRKAAAVLLRATD